MEHIIIRERKGFSLIEILVAIGIVAILASVVLVSMKEFGARGRSSKALSLLSSAVPSLVSCWGNGNTGKSPVSSSAICQTSGGVDIPGYGYWPVVGTGNLSNYSYDLGQGPGLNYSVGTKTNWYFGLYSSIDEIKVCCNQRLDSCVIMDDDSATCSATTPTN